MPINLGIWNNQKPQLWLSFASIILFITFFLEKLYAKLRNKPAKILNFEFIVEFINYLTTCIFCYLLYSTYEHVPDEYKDLEDREKSF